jgi:hypothetical protein
LLRQVTGRALPAFDKKFVAFGRLVDGVKARP